MPRPELTRHTPPADFQNYYWLKEELTAFCKQHNLPASGSKAQLSARIEQFLTDGTVLPAARRADTAKMPEVLSRSTLIGPGWHCSEKLRVFFEQEIGPQFHFNGVMRDFIRSGAGRTLQNAIDAWYAAQNAPRATAEIDPQFEYNRHIRAFFEQHPGLTLQDAIAAWRAKKAQPRCSSTNPTPNES